MLVTLSDGIVRPLLGADTEVLERRLLAATDEELPETSLTVAGPDVPDIVLSPFITVAGKLPTIPVIENRLEKLMILPPAAVDTISKK